VLKKVVVLVSVVLLSLVVNISAASGLAEDPNPANGAANVALDKVLSWTAGPNTASHDVYFGTAPGDVNSANRLIGDLNGDGIVDFNDVSLLTGYWLTNPAGSEPYAGVNDDDIVDFTDYALLAQDWMNDAGPVFKGNQDANSFNPGTLANSTTYYWRIDEVNGPNTVTGDVWSFTTRAEPEFTFVQASDPQMGWTQCGNSDYLWGTTISKINIINPDFLVVTGDLVNTSSNDTQAATYLNYAASLNPAIERYQLPGNHDVSDTPTLSKYSWFQSKFGYIPSNPMPWYSFTYGDSIFICLDSCILRNPGGSGLVGKDTEEINWLTSTLSGASGYTHKFVFMHHPLFVNDPNEAYDSRYNFQMPRRTELLNIFHTYSVNAVFAGHLHFNAYGRDGNLEMISTSSCTCGLGTPPTTPGLRIIKVYQDHIEQEYRTLDSIVP
jgi:hypothetical protein